MFLISLLVILDSAQIHPYQLEFIIQVKQLIITMESGRGNNTVPLVLLESKVIKVEYKKCTLQRRNMLNNHPYFNLLFDIVICD